LAELIRDINKFSNNVMARQLLLTIGNRALQIPATPERGAAVVSMWLANKGIDAPDLSIDNGSGLSRSERISARTLGRLLVRAYQSATMPEFIASLPLAGYDGTMRQRLNGHSVAGHAHIKTGTLNSVRSIAGYVLAASGRRYAVVCIVNHGNAGRSQEAQDALLQWVYENG
jgi:D-alanyl-D-alanine carboxypeptidase/D-alanyl-D-alanine-endopeptidase (penicillin-binding protein 4)